MNLPPSFLAPRLRLGLAFVAFMGIVAIGFHWIATKPGHSRRSRAQPGATSHHQDTDDKPFFYERVGQAPRGFGHAGHVSQLSYTLEIDLADQRQEAERLIDTLQERGVDAYYTPLARAGRIVYRVRHGVYPSREEAQAAQLALKNTRQVATKVVKLQ